MYNLKDLKLGNSSIVFSIGFLFLLIFTFFNISYADTNGIWMRAEDILGDEDKAVFGSDFMDYSDYEPDYGFFSKSLGIGTQDDDDGLAYFQSNQGKWTIGKSDDNKFIFLDNSSNRVFSLNSSKGYQDNSVININSNEYAAIDFGNEIEEQWGIGKDEYNNFYISQTGEGNRVFIEEDEDSEITMEENITINGENIKLEGNVEIKNNLKVEGEVSEDLDMGSNNIVNLDEPTQDSHATTKEYVDENISTLINRIENLEQEMEELSVGNVFVLEGENPVCPGDSVTGGDYQGDNMIMRYFESKHCTDTFTWLNREYSCSTDEKWSIPVPSCRYGPALHYPDSDNFKRCTADSWTKVLCKSDDN